MRKRWLAGWMLMSGVAVTAFAAGGGQEPDYSKVQIKATKVSGNIYMLEGEGGNIGVSTAQLPADVKVIPGHGAVSNLDDVREFTKMPKDTSAVVEKALKKHKTLEQMKREKILEPWKKWSGDFVNTDAFIETLYNSLTGTKGDFRKHN